MPHHRIDLDQPPPAPGQTLTVTGDEGWHAVAVKRLKPGQQVELLDGRGTIATANVQAADKTKRDARLTLLITSLATIPPTNPRIDVWAPLPKGDRASWMIDQLAQCGAASFAPLETERAVTDPGDHKLDRLRRVATEASKQCGRAWHLDLAAPQTLARLTPWCAANLGALIVIADAQGSLSHTLPPFTHALALIGPEGGFTPAERQAAIDAGAHPLRLAPHVLRTETAALAATLALVNVQPPPR